MLLSENLELSPQPRNLVLIHECLDRFEAAVQAKIPIGPGVYDAFRTATIEIATNILRHAYPPEIPSAPMNFELFLFVNRLEAIFHDHGIAFEPPTEIPSPALDEIEDILDAPEGNFGLFLAIQALDRLDYSRSPDGINRWRLIKQLRLAS